MKKSEEKVENVITKKVYPGRKLAEVKVGDLIKNRAVIVQAFEPRYFEICPECRKRVVEGECAVHGKVKGDKRALLNIVIDDGSESIRSVLFGESINTLGLTDEEIFSVEKFSEKKLALLGEEKIFYGNIRSNQLYNVVEFNIESVENIEVDKLIKELQAV